MKKSVLAAAVAGAFVVPAYAADVSISGVVEYHYNIADGSPDANDNNGDTPAFTIAATSQTNSGLEVSAVMTVDVDAGANEGGDHIAIAGDFGKLSIGDVSGAVDATGDWTDIAPENGGFGADGADHFASLAISPIANLSLVLSANPENSAHGGTADEGVGYSLTYDFGPAQVYYGAEESKGFGSVEGDTEIELTAYGVKTSVAGVYLAAESGEIKDGTSTVNFRGLAAKYSMGDITLGVERQTIDVDGAASYTPTQYTTSLAASAVSDAEMNVGYIQYDFGGGLTSFVEVKSDEKNETADETVVGVKYAF